MKREKKEEIRFGCVEGRERQKRKRLKKKSWAGMKRGKKKRGGS